MVYYYSYDSSTGVFTVPPGADRLYYFSTYLLVNVGELGSFEIVVNGVVFCTNWGDGVDGPDNPQATCSAVVDASEGKTTMACEECRILTFQ